MSIHNEYKEENCSYCRQIIKYGQKNRHINGVCLKISNIKNGPKSRYLYIGRANKTYGKEQSIFANPFVIGQDGTREEVINKFKEYAPTNKEIMDSLHLIDKENFLGCFCNFPFEDCHGRILFELREKQKNQPKYYTGVGSRSSPPEILEKIQLIAAALANKGYILRSGAANGSDEFFERGCDSVNGKKEIYLPWKGFNNSQSELYNVSDEALELAKSIHPAWSKLNQAAQKLHSRNCYQVAGLNLDTPSNFLICYTENGASIGGTRTAIEIANKYGITVYNLGKEGVLELVLKKCGIK